MAHFFKKCNEEKLRFCKWPSVVLQMQDLEFLFRSNSRQQQQLNRSRRKF